jgi:asparagine synthase (glutamine-hydrolysing)
MCGINGIMFFKGSRGRTFSDDDFVRMTDLLHHRGPDEDGFYRTNEIMLGMRRLRIIDLDTGKQPIRNEDGTIWTIFNGEIYNFKELRDSLLARGHTFYTKSDTETIVHLYEERGIDFVHDLQGMFAIALWDGREKKLVLARDRMGEKPLYYAIDEGAFVFGSELKSILSVPWIARAIDPSALNDYFSFLYVPCPKTIFKGIRKLPPAHVMCVQEGRVEITRYWKLEFNEDRVRKEADLIEEALDLLRKTIRREMISDVPLGAFLSGGIDSSIVVALMSQISSKPVETFTIGYEGDHDHFDERLHAGKVARQYKTHHHEFILSPNIAGMLDAITAQFDEPFADASAIPNYLIAKETRNFVTVALSGLGGDEVCAGYERYLGGMVAERYRKLPRFLTEKLLPAVVNHIPDSRVGAHRNERLKRFVNSAFLNPAESYFATVAKFNESEKARLFRPDLLETGDPTSLETVSAIFRNHEHLHLVNKMIATDLETYLNDDLLTLTDRMSMAHSLEVRVPFLDHRVVEFFAGIPPSMKLSGFTKKYLLKKVAERLLPRDVVYRRKKGFSVPLVLWFRNSLREYVYDVLSPETINGLGYFRYPYVAKIIDDHMKGRSNHDEKIWALINFVHWHRKYMN